MNVTLPLHCPSCGVLVKIEIAEWNYGSRLHSETLTCPACQATSQITVPGHIVGATPPDQHVR